MLDYQMLKNRRKNISEVEGAQHVGQPAERRDPRWQRRGWEDQPGRRQSQIWQRWCWWRHWCGQWGYWWQQWPSPSMLLTRSKGWDNKVQDILVAGLCQQWYCWIWIIKARTKIMSSMHRQHLKTYPRRVSWASECQGSVYIPGAEAPVGGEFSLS